jgi:hypothetical protein
MSAQQFSDDDKINYLENSVVVKKSPHAVWEALSSFGDVSLINVTVDESVTLNGSKNQAALGAEREVLIPDGITNIINKERIVTLIDGVYYTYEVYETENFPTKRMWVTYGVRLDHKGRTVLFSKVFYELNNAFATTFLRRKVKRINMDSLLAYKNFIENGERQTDVKTLRKRYHDHRADAENNMVVNLKEQ